MFSKLADMLNLNKFKGQLKSEFKGYNAGRLGRDFASGMTVAAVALPLALAFGVGSGADAAAGLITAIIGGLVISTLSGASFQISGPTGAMTAVLILIVSKYGIQGVFAVSFIAGVMLLVLGIFKLGKLITLIPGPVITGFTSGIAVIIALGQIDNFFGTTSEGEAALERLYSYTQLGFHVNFYAVITGLIVVFIMFLWPKKWSGKVPPSLIAIIVAAVASRVLGFDVPVVGSIPKTLLPDLRLNFGDLNLIHIPALISPAITVASLGMIESLLCGASGSQMKNSRFDPNQELIAQGVGNMIIPFFGGVPATAAIARTSVAIKSGCETRLTGIFHALGLLASMFLLSDIMSALPLSALAGVLMVTAWRMNDWGAIKKLFSSKFRGAVAQFVITMICTVIFDLTVAIVIGIELAIILFVAKAVELNVNFAKVTNKKLTTSDHDVESEHKNAYVVYITGVLFFSNIDTLSEKVSEIGKCEEIFFSLRGVPLIDFAGAQAFMETIAQLREKGIKVAVCGVQDKVMDTLKRCSIYDVLPEDRFFWSVDRALTE